MKITKDDIGREVILRNGDTVIITEVGDRHSYPVISSDVVAYDVNGNVYTHQSSELDIVGFVGTPKSRKISIDKTYQTRDGKSVRIICVDRDNKDYPVVGLVLDEGGERAIYFTSEGLEIEGCTRNWDLVEVKQRVKYAGFVNVYANCVSVIHDSRAEADIYKDKSIERLACVKVEIDCEEGDGL